MAKTAKKTTDRSAVDELLFLFDISRRLDAAIDLRDVVGPVLKVMSQNLGMHRGAVTLLNPQTGEILAEADHGLTASQSRLVRFVPGEGLAAKVIQAGRLAVVPRVSDDPIFLDVPDLRDAPSDEEVFFISVPIKLGKEVVGAIFTDRLFPAKASLSEDFRLLSNIAAMLAQAVRLRQAVLEERQSLLAENVRLTEALRDRFQPTNIIGTSRAMQEVYDLIGMVSKSDATVLVRGESGTGKELVAHAVHYNSRRAAKPFVKVNCAALPETVLESELFGHEQGAFTGAIAQRKGRFELADGGTIFLDEIGDLPPTTQIRLLRVLQEKEFERVGGVDTVKIDVRVITATNRNLEELIKQGRFREDLYYRLNVFSIHLPPLRERKTDIGLLADSFVEKYSRTNHKSVRRISTPAIDMLMSYHWPGNVRELENVIERAVVLSTDDVIHSHLLPPTLQTAEASNTMVGSLEAALENVEREMVIEALKTCRGNMAKAARVLGVSERSMGIRIRKFDIDFRRFRTSPGVAGR